MSDEVAAILSELTSDSEVDPTLTQLIPQVYPELRRLAESYLRGERTGHTLQATALVHEAYVRLARANGSALRDRAHILRLAAKVMRHILVDHARRRAAEKRGGAVQIFSLHDAALEGDGRHVELLEIDDALKRLATLSPENARVVELRYFGSCTIDETAEALGISTATVERHWRFARAWLKTHLSEEDRAEGSDTG